MGIITSLFWICCFIFAYLLIYWSADYFIDNLKELSRGLGLSSFILGLLIMGIDPEETFASILSAINNLPYIYLGNIIGNTIIAIGLCFGLPALLKSIKFERVDNFFIFILITSIIVLDLGFFLPSGNILITGAINLLLFGAYMIFAFKNRHEVQKIIEEELEEDEFDPKYHKKNEMDYKKNEMDYKKNEINLEETRQDLLDNTPVHKKYALKVLLGFVIILIGGEFLVNASEHLIVLLGMDQSFFGLIIIAFVTNAEEITLVFKSIKKNAVEVGIGGMIGKMIWNLTLVYGIGSFFIIS
ncbi:MAG: sodium:calcium antiporter, partial [Promethearchaeota archaeon]